jgi:flavorubredoxin
MEDLLHDIVNHNLQNRKVAIIENGSWAPASGKLMREEISKMKNMEIIGDGIKLLSALKGDQLSQIDALADAIAESIKGR